jgi:hypothetical protein
MTLDLSNMIIKTSKKQILYLLFSQHIDDLRKSKNISLHDFYKYKMIQCNYKMYLHFP